MSKSPIPERKKKALAEAPGTLEELARAGQFNTMSGLYAFLKRHKAIIERRTVLNVRFPD